MTRDEAQAVIDTLREKARDLKMAARQHAFAQSKERLDGACEGTEDAARMLAEALEKSEADRGRLINVAATAGAAVVDAQTRLDRTSKKNLSEYARAEESLIAAIDRKREADAALAKVTP